MGDDRLARLPSAKAPVTDIRLTPELICQIEDGLRRAGPFGEVHLVLVKGKLRFVKVVVSECAGDAPADGK